MMRVAALSWQREGSEQPEFVGNEFEMANLLRTLVANCLTLADYTKPHDHLVESLILHLNGEYISTRDANPNVWIFLGILIRIAMRMGYHRDSRHLPGLSPFHVSLFYTVALTIFF